MDLKVGSAYIAVWCEYLEDLVDGVEGVVVSGTYLTVLSRILSTVYLSYSWLELDRKS